MPNPFTNRCAAQWYGGLGWSQSPGFKHCLCFFFYFLLSGLWLSYHHLFFSPNRSILCGGCMRIFFLPSHAYKITATWSILLRYNRADNIRAMEYSALRMSGLEVCMAGCWWVDVEIPFRFKTLILFFFQTVNTFWIPFEPLCYLEFMQQNKITYAYILINFFSKKVNIQSILLQHLSIHIQHFGHTLSTFSYKMFN